MQIPLSRVQFSVRNPLFTFFCDQYPLFLVKKDLLIHATLNLVQKKVFTNSLIWFCRLNLALTNCTARISGNDLYH